MKTSIRKFAGSAAVSLTLVSAACQSEVTAEVGDVLANDSTLALAVLGANQDSALTPDLGDTAAPFDSVASAPTPSVAISASPSVAPVSKQPTVARASARRPERRVASSRRKSATRTRTASAVKRTSTGIPSKGTAVTRVTEPSRMWVVLPSGSELELQSSQQVCTNSNAVGDQFNVTLAESVVRANGTLIPEGAVARGEVISISGRDGGNAALGVRISEITFEGRTYPVSSRVTHTDLKRIKTRSSTGRAQCLPDGGRITAELVQPLRIQL